MNIRQHAINAANIADKLTYQSRRRKDFEGRDVVYIPYDEAMAMVDQLVTISHKLNDIADDDDRSQKDAK